MKLKGFDVLVKLCMKARPEKPKTVEDIWNKFLYIVFMGGKRSDPEINFLINMFKSKKLLDLDFVKKTDGEDWRDAVIEIIKQRTARIKDEDILLMLKDFEKEIFRISASIKGGARFFKKEEITPEKLGSMLDTKEKAWEFIDGLAVNEDVSNIKYTKIIIWLHSMGYAQDFCPPSWQTKQFLNNEVGPYYQFYDDDKYFMKKAQEFAEGVKKKIKCTTKDVATAIFYYTTLKNMLPPRSPVKKSFSPETVVKFLKKKNLTLVALSKMFSDFDERQKLAEQLNYFCK
ncbi:MAG: hypothetical protein NT120_02140 [Candidatus Aenigmarchaeota archaeon]|nr:hypothetical protein [Candidatus Aenigmarchaeota archaeon]